MTRWVEAVHAAAANRSSPMARSLASVAKERADNIEKSRGTARLADCCFALDARGATASRSPSRVTFKHARVRCGWARSPIGTNDCGSEIPDADSVDHPVDDLRVNTFPDVVPLSEQAALNKEAAGWVDNWAVGAPYRQHCFLQNLLVAPHPITLWALDFATAFFSASTGLDADNNAPRAVLRLLDESWMSWSAALNLALIALLPKRDGGLRPIGLLPTWIRIWMRATPCVARAWAIGRPLMILLTFLVELAEGRRERRGRPRLSPKPPRQRHSNTRPPCWTS